MHDSAPIILLVNCNKQGVVLYGLALLDVPGRCWPRLGIVRNVRQVPAPRESILTTFMHLPALSRPVGTEFVHSLSKTASTLCNHPSCCLCPTLLCSPEDATQLLLCEGCPAVVHMFCMDPPLERVPAGDWFCHKCAKKQSLADVERVVDVRVLPDNGKRLSGEL